MLPWTCCFVFTKWVLDEIFSLGLLDFSTFDFASWSAFDWLLFLNWYSLRTWILKSSMISIFSRTGPFLITLIVSVGHKNTHLIPELLNSLHGREDVYIKIEICKLDFEIRFRSQLTCRQYIQYLFLEGNTSTAGSVANRTIQQDDRSWYWTLVLTMNWIAPKYWRA